MSILAWALALLYPVWAGYYFGGNFFPRSDAEIVADGIALLLLSLAILVTTVEKGKRI
jgi:membrane protein DedA with SNARE-associated domain